MQDAVEQVVSPWQDSVFYDILLDSLILSLPNSIEPRSIPPF
jgi:hypothetical protein